LLGALCLALVAGLAAGSPCARCQESSPAPEKPRPFEWRSTYAEARDAALKGRRPFIVYLPPAHDREPAAILKLPALLGAPPLVEGVRVGADEVLKLLDKLKVTRLPALALVDRRENVIAKWEGGIPQDLMMRLQSLVARIADQEDKDARIVAEARRLASLGRIEDAYRKAVPLFESSRAAPEHVRAARDVESQLVQSLRIQAARILAREGIRPDAEIRKALMELRDSTTHAGFRAEVEHEHKLFEVTRTGAK